MANSNPSAYGSATLDRLQSTQVHKFNLDPTTIPPLYSKLELRDLDFIWCVATIVNIVDDVTRSEGSLGQISLRYDGWDSIWDETLSYPNDRLARLFSYTKQAKAWVKLTNTIETRWPAILSIRNGQPGSDFADKMLVKEKKVFCRFVQPAPKFITDFICGGSSTSTSTSTSSSTSTSTSKTKSQAKKNTTSIFDFTSTSTSTSIPRAILNEEDSHNNSSVCDSHNNNANSTYNFLTAHLKVDMDDVTQSKYGVWLPASYFQPWVSVTEAKVLSNPTIQGDIDLKRKLKKAIRNVGR